MAKIIQNSYEVASPLLSCIPQTALDAFYGAAALADAGQNLAVLSRNWNEFMARSGRSDLAKNSVLGSSLLSFFRDEQQKQVFRNLLDSMANDELGTHNQVVDLGSKDSPFYVQFHVHPLWKDGVLIGYLLHCLDTTKEHANRLTLIDHDRQLLNLREAKGNYESELAAAKELIGSVAKEQADREKELKQLQEKASRKEKALKAAIKQAELSANNMASKDRELDTLRSENKQLSVDLTEARQQLDLTAGELTSRDEEIGKLTDQMIELQTAHDVLAEKLESSSSQDSEAALQLQEAEARITELTQQLQTAQDEKDSLKADLETIQSQLQELEEDHEKLQAILAKTEQQSAEAAENFETELRSSVAAHVLLSNTLNALQIPTCWINPAGHVEMTNQAFRDLFELDSETLEAIALSELFLAEDVEALEALLSNPFGQDSLALHLLTGEPERPIKFIPQFENGQFIGCAGACESANADQPAAHELADEPSGNAHGLRALSGDLADSFGDLLTAVIGHASLAAAEAETDSPTLSDIRAIEESAGEAAHLVRKLHALSGKSRHNSVIDLKASIVNFARRYYDSASEDSRVQLELPEDAIKIPVDSATMDVILKGVSVHADLSVSEDSIPLWKLSEDDEYAKLSISYQGTMIAPNGWFDESVPAKDEPGYELYFAREAARAFGGRLEIHELNSAQELVLYLPLVTVKTVG